MVAGIHDESRAVEVGLGATEFGGTIVGLMAGLGMGVTERKMEVFWAGVDPYGAACLQFQRQTFEVCLSLLDDPNIC